MNNNEMKEYKKRTNCAICGNEHLDTILDYGEVPLAGFFPKEDELKSIKKYNLGLQYCSDCHLMQTNSTIDPDVLFKDYRYLSSVGLQKHFDEYSNFLIDRFSLNNASLVLEFGSNDGVLLKPMMDKEINITGFEPSDNVSKLAIEKGCNVINDYFSIDTVKKYCKESQYDLITSSNCFAHIDDIHSVVKGINYTLKENGHYVFEVHYGKNIIEESQYDNVYHEHIYYYTVNSLKNLFEQYDMTIIDVVEMPIHAGSIRVIVKNSKEEYNDKVKSFLNEEERLGMTSIEYYKDFEKNVLNHKHNLIQTINFIKRNGGSIGAYGASGRANILCNFCGLDDSMIDYIIDESPERYDRYINNIPIYNADKINPKTDYILIFAWNYSKMIMSKLVDKYNFQYIIPFPDIRTISNIGELNYEKTL
jgi:SAM-dependent methyltransferase